MITVIKFIAGALAIAVTIVILLDSSVEPNCREAAKNHGLQRFDTIFVCHIGQFYKAYE